MQHKSYKRKLAVIVSADVAGYARLTEVNEIDVHNHLKKRLQLIRDNTNNFHGQVLRIHGDGCLCSFDSVVDALKACLEIQQSSMLLNANLPHNSQICFRIGIHLSEVIFDQEPYGNGVNIAVRLQQSAAPGEIFVSKETIQSIENLQGFQFSKKKKLSLKNISNPIYAYKLLGASLNLNAQAGNFIQNFFAPKLFYAALVSSMFLLNMVLLSYVLIDQKSNQEQAVKVEPGSASKFSNVYAVADAVVEMIEVSQNDEPEVEVNLLNDDRYFQALTQQVNSINEELQRIRGDFIRDKLSMNAQMAMTTNILSKQEALFSELLTQQENNKFLLSNYNNSSMVYFDKESQYQDILSPNYIIESLDSLETRVIKDEFSGNSLTSNNNFGCLSCVHPNASGNNVSGNKGNIAAKKTAVLVGRLNDNEASAFGSQSKMLEDFMYSKLQHSIEQSRLGAKIGAYTRIADIDAEEIDNDSLAQLCNSPDIMLVASYELESNYWNITGTHLRFYNCSNNRSIVHLEKNLAPTIYNVQKPYLTDDALLSVDKSVDYMIDKLVINEYQEL